MKQKAKKMGKKKIITGFLCLCIILLCVICMGVLAAQKEEPVRKKQTIRPLAVSVQQIDFHNFQAQVKGHGTVISRDVVKISPLVSGSVIWVNPKLETGSQVQQDDILFKIDQQDFMLTCQEIIAQEKELEETIRNLSKQYEYDQIRILNLSRNKDLALSRFERHRKLYEENRIGTKSAMEQAEIELNSATEAKHFLGQTLMLYPGKINMEKFKLEACRARLKQANLNLERCNVIAPFSGKIKEAFVENGMYVTRAMPVFTLSNNKNFEIHISLTAEDMFSLYDTNHVDFLKGSQCSIHWVEQKKTTGYKGVVDRLVSYDSVTQTMIAAVKVDNGNQENSGSDIPLIEGMFCEVFIKGKKLPHVVKLPKTAILKENSVFRVVNNRLEKTKVDIIRQDEEIAYVTDGVFKDDKVVVSHVTIADNNREVTVIQ